MALAAALPFKVVQGDVTKQQVTGESH